MRSACTRVVCQPNWVLGFPPPWDAAVVQVTWTQQPPPQLATLRLPRCLLYFGQASGTSLFFDGTARDQRALRLPTASLAIEILPNTDSALPQKGSGSCS